MSSPFPPPCTCNQQPHDQHCPQFSVLRDGSGFFGSSIDDASTVVTESVNSDGRVKNYETCGARKRQPDEDGNHGNCARPAGWGTDHVGTGRCKLHGGSTKDHKKAAQKDRAKKARDTFGLPVEIDPAVALLQEVWRTQGHVMWLGAVVQQLRKKDVAWGITKRKTGGEDHGVTEEAKINAYVALYQDERKHLARVSAEAIKAGVEVKRLKIEEQRAELIVTMLGTIFDSLELSDDQAAKLETLVPDALKSLAEVPS